MRRARPDDVAALSDLFGQLGYSASADEVGARLAPRGAGGNAVCLVAEREGVVAGVLDLHLLEPLHVAGRWALIASLVVRETRRGTGVGARLLAAAEQLAWEAGCGHVELSSSEKRIRAHAFYEREGYEEVRKRFVKRRPAA